MQYIYNTHHINTTRVTIIHTQTNYDKHSDGQLSQKRAV
jgi:hypothetical protein